MNATEVEGATQTAATRTTARSGLLFARRDERAKPVHEVALRADPSDAQVVDLENGEIRDVWTYYRMTRALAAREKLILFYSPLVGQVATRIGMRLPNTVEQADLVSYGMFGLIDAIDKFDPDRDIRFETYAQTRVRGAIIDGLRSMDWVPRSVRAKARSLERAVEELEARLRRAPSREELADHLGIALGELHHIESANSSSSIVALDELLALGDGIEQRLAPSQPSHHDVDDPAGSYESGEQRRILFDVVSRLGNRDRLILMLYYFESLTLSEIGAILGVTESRISQLHSGAMKQLRSQLTDMGVR
ncbi:FliA/WhiG family RNA polymerase sigma factor [Rarobacter faecitabidus]|nr:FliA/WhiG family RNA polymerase sigma factor [Rarobacter faecitabidus]